MRIVVLVQPPSIPNAERRIRSGSGAMAGAPGVRQRLLGPLATALERSPRPTRLGTFASIPPRRIVRRPIAGGPQYPRRVVKPKPDTRELRVASAAGAKLRRADLDADGDRGIGGNHDDDPAASWPPRAPVPTITRSGTWPLIAWQRLAGFGSHQRR